ncbi:MarR family transcriptional regulator [Vibrio parahaemolyticus]|uniref:MarR family transcriptional regulator n=1 Tax=Vibrio parahaemolyticus TaxID=670 RepID=UPI0028791B36|nr:MarR family transcriptional regulator [Vibrio parahaemolyticus]MDS1909417.1 MarR family transcriptional regulator [Vibrio parahaemolyticus]
MDLDQKRNALRVQLETAINDLKSQSESQGCKIAQRRRSGYLYAVDAARNIVLETWFTKLLRQHGTILKKYSSSNAIHLAEIIESYGGLNKTIKLIETVLALRGFGLHTQRRVNYADQVLLGLKDLRSLTPQHQEEEVRWNSVLPYCALCWRLRSRSHYYCEKHHPIRSTKLYKQQQYAAITALKRLPNQNSTAYEKYLVQPNKQKNLGRQLYALVSGYAPHPRVFLRHCKDSAMSGDWITLSKNIVQTCKVTYPASYKKIKQIKPDDFRNWPSWCIAIVRCLDPTEPNAWNEKECLTLFNELNTWTTLIGILHRFECVERINSIETKRGPDVGYGANLEQHQLIKELLKQQLATNSKTNLSDIARTLGLSRQRVHQIIKKNQLLS